MYAKKLVEDFIQAANAHFQALPQMTEKLLVPSLEDLLNRDASRFPMKDINEFSDPVDHGGRGSAINKISVLWNGARDRFLAQELMYDVEQGRHVFAVFGSGHAIALKPVLDRVFGVSGRP
jgi:hypothetical protein